MTNYYVPDTEWNRANSPNLIGRFYRADLAPSYTQLRESFLPSVSYPIAEFEVLIAVAVAKVDELVRRVHV